ncbi:hypothetical protein DIU31_028510 [Mucilaginibacter rubeus]|uniref:HNH nuclease domain-containing protein n=1 Tax=Mucilaginibacter rubeus TaxID=2027860 RepID=A0AAE6ML09_9SPHI|nr:MULTISPECIES: hypothetical protein [Mucilaginibacter]QEM07251.1 hypothetical protein DIU31_028510 [Mucilaginibacter rubeus]QEM19706.1 hypothetical protein DIU38_028085 [Mucilaginibacter gossypii]QTE43596.1 hypothetical protein J3L19_32540 [Mucilaginibacter rubeus]QTE50196.1 hypothetical protein J3L21_32495 [Mucilaginibacter rubeus]QTE55284.1 hypothetical protein J3L23_24115 [Mucilaginibacter rubeus]
MRYIKISELKAVFEALHGTGSFIAWEERANRHLAAITTKTQRERKTYWAANNIWTDLYDAMSELSGHKCWYTESKENSSEWQVDHFRPKAKSLNSEGEIISATGYWWLSYYWRNFRLSGSLSNLLRKDRFVDDDDVFGKGSYFPLKTGSQFSLENDMRCRGEIPMLLDPTISRDVGLLSFDQNGGVFATYNADDNDHNHNRAVLSIKCYGLEHSPLIRGRKRVWDECESIVELTQSDLKVHINNDELIDQSLEECYQRLADLAAKNQPHSIVVFNFVQEKLNNEDYYWLNEALKAIA